MVSRNAAVQAGRRGDMADAASCLGIAKLDRAALCLLALDESLLLLTKIIRGMDTETLRRFKLYPSFSTSMNKYFYTYIFTIIL